MAEPNIMYIIKENKGILIDLLDKDTDLNMTDEEGDSLIHIVLKIYRFNETYALTNLELLLDYGLDINDRNSKGKTILDFAIELRYKKLIDLCIRRNADMKKIDSEGNTLAHFVIEEEYRKIDEVIKNKRSIQKEESNSSNFVDFMVSKGIDFFYTQNAHGYSAFYLASHLGLQHILLTLLKRIDDLSTAEINQTPLLCAFIKSRHLSNFKHKTLTPINSNLHEYFSIKNIAKIILKKNIFVSNGTLNEALHYAIKSTISLDEIYLILQRTSYINKKNSIGESLIKAFTKKCQERPNCWNTVDCMKIMKELVNKGADINELDENGETISLRWFRLYPNFKALRFLKDCGSNFSGKTNDSKSFLHIISRQGIEAGMIEFVMRQRHLDPNMIDSYGKAPLHAAIVSKNYAAVNALIEFGAKIDVCDRRGRSPIHLAVYGPEIVEFLIENGADVNSKDKEGKTPLHFVSRKEVIWTLVTAGAFVDAPDNHGRTPLFYAISKLNLESIKELLKLGANIRDSHVEDNFQNFNPMQLGPLQYRMEHLIKLSTVGLFKKIQPMNDENKERLQGFVKKCEKEVVSLKTHFIDDSTSIYKLLRKNKNRRCAYIDNKELKNLIKNPAIKKKFPNYYVLIMGCYYEAKIRKSLLEKAICVLKNIIEIDLPDLCIDHILMYLSNLDLSCLVKLGNNLSSSLLL